MNVQHFRMQTRLQQTDLQPSQHETVENCGNIISEKKHNSILLLLQSASQSCPTSTRKHHQWPDKSKLISRNTKRTLYHAHTHTIPIDSQHDSYRWSKASVHHQVHKANICKAHHCILPEAVFGEIRLQVWARQVLLSQCKSLLQVSLSKPTA